MKSRRARWAGALFLIGVGCWLALYAAAWWLSRPAPAAVQIPPTWLAAREIRITAPDATRLHGWYAPGNPGAGVVVLLHGIRGNKADMLGRARFLRQAGFGVLLLDLPAHGASGGDRIGFGKLEAPALRAACGELRRLAPGERMGLLGVSLGGATALFARPPEAVALVLESIYPDIDSAAANRLALYFGEWARPLAPLLLTQLKPRLGVDRAALRPIDTAAAVLMPVLQLHGADDQHTSVSEARALHQRLGGPKEFVVIPRAAHVDLHHAGGAEYERLVLEFLRRHVRGV